MTIANRALRAQLNLVEPTFTSEQRDASTRLSEDLCLRRELAACLARNRLEAIIASGTVGNSTFFRQKPFP